MRMCSPEISCCGCTAFGPKVLDWVPQQVTSASPARPTGANVTVKELLDWLMPRLPENMKEQMSHAQVGRLWQKLLYVGSRPTAAPGLLRMLLPPSCSYHS